jgi:hypothetical protein
MVVATADIEQGSMAIHAVADRAAKAPCADNGEMQLDVCSAPQL